MTPFINETFTGANGTAINGFNSWTAVGGAGFQIQSNRAAKTDNGAAYCHQTITIAGIPGRYRATFSKFTGNGQRYYNGIVIGTNNTSNISNFINNGMSFLYGRSGSNFNNTYLQVYDKTTLVAQNLSPGFQVDGSDVTIDVTVNPDGSGTMTLTQGVSSATVSWSARTWSTVNNIHGVFMESNGVDGIGQTTRSQVDDVILEQPGATPRRLMMMGVGQ